VSDAEPSYVASVNSASSPRTTRTRRSRASTKVPVVGRSPSRPESAADPECGPALWLQITDALVTRSAGCDDSLAVIVATKLLP